MSEANIAAIITTVVTGAVTITTLVIGFLTLWVKLKYGVEKAEEAATKAQVVEGKIDNNTVITTAASIAAATNADNAAKMAEQLNGKLEERISSIVRRHVDPIVVVLKTHSEQDDKNMSEIRQALGELRDRIASKSIAK